MSKTGFSTLNRWLGRKNKEKTLANGKLSKSSNNLSISTNTINDSSQVEYNRITPLPVATTNAPFEQTFRITVLLPKDQLYVTRLGARTPLNKLLELICDNKSLDIEKYEFRNPADPSQIYDCELTIGAVGLSEIRLCHKSESYDTFNADEIIKLHRTSLIRDSLSSSSDFSSRISKHTTKTTSPYSSTNSLNSMDSCGLNYTRTPVIQPPLAAMALRKNSMASLTTARISPTPATVTSTTTTIMGKILAPPPRKKRTAPRPPKISPTSQNVIPEKTLNGDGDSLHRNDCEISDINGNIYNNGNQKVQHIIKNKREETEVEMEDEKIYESIDTNLNGYADDTVLYAQVQKKNAINHIQMNNGPDTGAAQNNFNSNDDGNDVVDNVNENCKKLPEPSPRKRIVQVKKKSAPAPPPRNSSSTYYNDNNNSKSSNIDEDTISLISTNIMASSTPTTPIKITPNRSSDSLYTKVQIINGSLSSLENEITKSQTSVSTLTSEKSFKVEPHLKQQTANEIVKELETKPKPIPRMTTTTLLNATDVDHNLKNLDVERENHLNMKTGLNISKVILNRTPTPEPCSLMSEPTKENFTYEQTEEDHGQQQQQQQEKKEDAEESEEQEHNITVEDDNVSKQADSGIGEPIPSPLPDSLPNSEISTGDCKSNFESSSDDDDLIKVYNFKLGKTLVKPLVESSELTEQPLEELTPLRKEANNVENVIQIEEVAARFQDQMQNKDDIKQKISSDANAWTFSIPISPPPTFADGKFSHNINEGETVKTDAPITPKITERPLLDFENIEKDGHSHTSLYKTEVNEGNKAKVVKNDYLNKEERNLQEDSKINKELNLNLIKQQNKTDAELLDKQRKCNKYNEFDKSMKVAWKVENSEALISPTAPLNGLLEELSSIINGQGVDSLVRNRSSDTTTIESAKPNTLENFSITNIKSQNMPKWREQRENSKTIIATTTTKITSTTNTTSKILTNAKSNKPATATTMNFQTTSITMEEEKLYRKRSNANNLKQRRSIARADSFHSTVSTLTMEDSNLQGRSSSQLALNKLDNGHNNGITRRSSSELSIGESPSLQSLEVIKTILRNHKNKPCNNNDNINNKSNEMAQEEVMVVRARRPSQELKFASLELKPKSGIEKITNTATSSTAIPTSSNCEIKKYKAQEEAEEEGEKDASTELAKLYRYSGRPSVNVGTWNERPKVQVSIKNEGDYIFGGKKVSSTSSSTFPLENYCKSMTAFTYQDATAGKYQNGIGRTTATRTTASSLFVPNTLKTKSATFNHRLSMPNHEFHNNNNTNNNIKVKPLRDVVYENEPINAKFIAKQKRPTVETVLRPQTQVIVNPSIIAAATTTTTITTAAAAPTNQYRIQQKRFSTPPNIINSNSNNSKNSNNNNNQDNQNNITYSTSMKRNNHVPGGVEENKTIVAPFGQNTLRRTGLKEKFLAKESEQQQQQQQQQQQKLITKSNATNTSASIYIDGNDQENNNIEMSGRTASNTITMNLQKTFKEETKLNNNKHSNNNNNINNNIKANNNYSNNHNNEKVSITITKPKPPSMLAFKQIQLKTVKADRTPTPSSEPEDTRDQLMAAIRNFNRTQLKKA